MEYFSDSYIQIFDWQLRLESDVSLQLRTCERKKKDRN